LKVRTGLRPLVKPLKLVGFVTREGRARLRRKAPEVFEFFRGFAVRTPADEALIKPVLDLASHDTTTRKNAINELKKVDDLRVVKPLICMLKDPVTEVRILAAYSLGVLKDIRAVNPLIDLLKDNEVKIRVAAATALGKFKLPEVAQALIEATEDPETKVRVLAAMSLGNFVEYPQTRKALERLLKDPDDFVAAQAAFSLRSKKK